MDDVTLTDETDRYGTLSLQGPKTRNCSSDLAAGNRSRRNPRIQLRSTSHSTRSLATITRKSFANAPSADIRVDRKDLEPTLEFSRRKIAIPQRRPRRLHRPQRPPPRTLHPLVRLRLRRQTNPPRSRPARLPHQLRQRLLHRPGNRRTRPLPRPSQPPPHLPPIPNADQPPAAGTAPLADGKEVGTITSASPLPATQQSIGMGYVRKESAAPGTELTFTTPEGSGKATVI